MRPVPPQFAGPVNGSSDLAGGARTAAWTKLKQPKDGSWLMADGSWQEHKLRREDTNILNELIDLMCGGEK